MAARFRLVKYYNLPRYIMYIYIYYILTSFDMIWHDLRHDLRHEYRTKLLAFESSRELP